ncbi:radical SAM protein [Candidatus Micrarchaeota archaeon]|nr:radical SAM protein [Candidatus Micrarchaeota archaeon]
MELNPGELKLDLYCKGIRLHESCSADDDGRGLLRTRGGLGSGLEVLLPGGLYTNIPVEEEFAKKSPYSLHKEKGKYLIRKEGKAVSEIKLLSRPKFYDAKTSTGKPMHRIGVLQGTYLGIYPTEMCGFWKMKPKMNCKFCSVGLNLGAKEEQEKSVQEVVETAMAARDECGVTFVHFNSGFCPDGNELEKLEPYIKAIKEKTGLLVGVQAIPSDDLKKYDRLKKMGVDHLSFCIELYDKEQFCKTCPGKAKYLGQERFLKAIDYCAKLFGKGKVAGEIIAGLESPASTMRAIEEFAKMGAVSTVCVFRPCKGTDYEKTPPPEYEDMLPIFRKLYTSCLDYGIPFGIAPNIKVSIVMLPEECAYLVPNLTPKQKAQLAKIEVMKAAFLAYFKARLALRRNRK